MVDNDHQWSICWLVVSNMNFIFPNSWDDDPIWLIYFSGGLKPSTRYGLREKCSFHISIDFYRYIVSGQKPIVKWKRHIFKWKKPLNGDLRSPGISTSHFSGMILLLYAVRMIVLITRCFKKLYVVCKYKNGTLVDIVPNYRNHIRIEWVETSIGKTQCALNML